MFRPPRMLSSLAVSLTAAGSLACSSQPEEPILSHFFTASRIRDNTTIASFSSTSFEPHQQGIVTSFEIVNVTPEVRTPLTLKALAKDHDDARAEDAELTKRKLAYQKDHMEAITRVLKLEAAKGKISGKDADVQAVWTKFREETVQVTRKVSDARRKLVSESAIVELSMDDPRKKVDISKYEGDMVSKDVTVSAPVKLPDGRTVDKTLIVTMQRAVLKADQELAGKWIITSVRDAAGKTS